MKLLISTCLLLSQALAMYAAEAVYPIGDAVTYRIGPDGKLSITRDQGETWHDLGKPAGGLEVLNLVVDPLDPEVLYTISAAGLVARSVDGGATWSPFAAPLPEAANSESGAPFAVNAEESTTLWFAGKALWRYSLDVGRWERTQLALEEGRFSAVAASPSDPDLLVAADSLGNVYRITRAMAPDGQVRVQSEFKGRNAVTAVRFDPEEAAVHLTYSLDNEVMQRNGVEWEAIGENCTPTFSPSRFSLSGSEQSRTLRIYFRRAKDRSQCSWQVTERTGGTIVITNFERESGNGGNGSATFKINANNQTNGKARTLYLYYSGRVGHNGGWTVRKSIRIYQRHR